MVAGLLEADLVHQAMGKWSKAVWQASFGRSIAGVGLPLLREVAELLAVASPTSRNQVRGPTGAVVQELKRIGWNTVSFNTWEDDRGELLDMLRYSPSFVVARAKAGYLSLKASEVGAALGLGGKVGLDPVRKVLDSKISLVEKGIVKAFITGGVVGQ